MPERTHLAALTSLRFVAAAMIVLHHVKGNLGVPTDYPYGLNNGWGFGVSFFFLLSGFILTYTYPTLPTREAKRRFLVSRFARLWPAHMAALAITLLIASNYAFYLSPLSSPVEFFAHLGLTIAMMNTWIPIQWAIISFNDPNWSIATEFAFYLAFPFLISNFYRTWWWKLGGVALFTAAVLYLAHVFQVPPPKTYYDGVTTFSLLYVWPGIRLLEFVAGMCTALAWQRFGHRFKVGLVLGTVIEVAALAFFVTQMQSGGALLHALPSAFITQEFTHWFFSEGITIIPGCVLIFVMACEMGWISRALAIRPLTFLGDISYSIYLLHFPVLRANVWDDFPLRTVLPHSVQLIGTLAVVFVLACLVWAFVEKPSKRYIVGYRTRRARISPSAVSVSVANA